MTTRPLSPHDKLNLPPFNLGMGAATATLSPPFTFPNISLTYFPLAADIEVLASFCDRYLNIAPDFAYFKPAAPMVLLSSVFYGHAGAAGAAAWTSDNELLFGIPLEWWEPGEKGGGDPQDMVFKGTAIFSPFIWVDSVAAQIEGREVFGWPKQEGWLVSQQSAWAQNPMNDLNVLQMNAEVFDESVVDANQAPCPVLRIYQQAEPTLLRYPPNPYAALAESASIASRQFSYAFDASNWLGGMARGLFSGAPPDLKNLLSLAKSMGSSALNNTINLKQMRDCQAPGLACYQSITNAVMQTNQITEAGLLGENALLRGDMSGGYTIDIIQHDSLPIVDSLGLLSEKRQATPEGIVDTFRPILPFWMTAHMVYKKGENIAWRFRDTNADFAPWRDDKKIETQAQESVETTEEQPQPQYMELGPQAYQVMEGPFAIDRASVRVLPLLASKKRLQEFLCAENVPSWQSFFGQVPRDIASFEPWGDIVYLVASVFDEHSLADNLGLWSETQIEFAIPVKCTLKNEVVHYGWVSPFMFSSSSLGATTARELNGWRMLQADMVRPANSWIGRPDENTSGDVLLNMKMDLPVNFSGATGMHTLLEIVNGQSKPGYNEAENNQIRSFALDVKKHVESMAKATTKARTKSDSNWTKKKRFKKALRRARAHVDKQRTFNQYSFKQFRDAADPNKACYQALTNTPLKLTGIKVEECPEPLHVHIYRFPTQPIVDMLGLKVKTTHKDANGIYDAVQAIRPFSFTAEGESENGQDICWNTGQAHWLENKDVMSRLFPPSTTASGSAERENSESQRKSEEKSQKEIVPQMLVNGLLSSGWHATPNSEDSFGDSPEYVLNVEHYGKMAESLFPRSQRVPGHENLWAPYKKSRKSNSASTVPTTTETSIEMTPGNQKPDVSKANAGEDHPD